MTYSKEIKRWADSPDGTKVWKKFNNLDKEWLIAHNPFSESDTIYIVDDGYAKLRKAQIDGKAIEYYHHHIWVEALTDAWNIATDISKYRIKPDEPIYYYKWETCIKNIIIKTSDSVTDNEATKRGYHRDPNWRKIESSKRTWDY